MSYRFPLRTIWFAGLGCLLAVLARPCLAAGAREQTQQHTIHRIMGSDVLADNSQAVLRRAVELPPEQRYARLKRWVLPGPEHADFRLNGHFSSLSSAPPVAQYTREEHERLRVAEAAGRGRMLVGGSLLAPALELVETAKELDRLGALRAEIEAARPAPSGRREAADTGTHGDSPSDS
jgi:hypothetical protein